MFVRRPPGAIFANTFLCENVVYSDERQNRYRVKQLGVPADQQIRVCPNPDCEALFPPRRTAPEMYCTDCGTVLETGAKDLILIEMPIPIPDNVARVVAKSLSHGSVRAPLISFTERLGGLPRYCMVMSQVGALETASDTLQALKWGVGLANGLDYLHDNGITLNGRLDNSCFGLVAGRAVWAGFNGCSHHPDGYVTDRQVDVHALASLIFQWLTGRTKFERDPSLPPGVNHAFEQALAVPGPATGGELALLFERALDEITAPQAVDHHLGRRTHVGMVRDLNEDSVFALEINRIQQSFSQPLGVYAVADGMGGHAAGEIASGAIVNVIAQMALNELVPAQIAQEETKNHLNWLRETVEAANREVLGLRKAAGTDMGSTLVAAVLEGTNAYIAHVGDSRAYLINARGIQRLTTDHSLVERLIATNQITREEARFHPQRNVIYRTIGDKAQIEVEVAAYTLSIDDYFLLCSDGLSGMVEDQAINRIVMEAASPQAACDELIEAANAAGGDDNVSVVIVKIMQS
jgi:protein phosphatase